MIVASLAFYLFAFMAVIGALNVIFQRNPVHSVLWLIFTFFNAAGLFVLLGAEFVAMILDINIVVLREGFLRYMPIGALIGIVLLVELALVFGGWAISPEASGLRTTPIVAGVSNTQALGAVLYTKYAYLFQVSGVILLVAMIGAIVLTHRRRSGPRRQTIENQVNRSAADTLEIVKVQTGRGVSL